MRVHRSRWLLAAAGAAALAVSGFSARAADTPAFPTLQAISDESQSLYKQISGSLVRVTIVQSPAAVLDPALRADYEKWRTSQPVPPGGGAGGGGRGRRDRGGNPGGNTPNTMGIGNPNPGPGQAMRGGQPGFFGGQPGGYGGRGGFGGGQPGGSVSGFLQTKIQTLEAQQPQTDDTKTEIDRLRTLQLHVTLVREGVQGDMNALVLDNQGDLLLLTGLLREAHADPLAATLPGGGAARAKFIGASLYGGYTILQLDSATGLKPVHLNTQAVRPGQLLMNVSAGSMGLSFAGIKAVGGGFGGGGGPGDDRGGTFIFDIQGALVSASTGGAPWQGERGNLSAARLEREIAYIKTGGTGGKPTDLEPRQLGITFGPPADLSAATTKALDGRPGVKVTSVTPDSLAEKAGIKSGDVILSIDKRPISELVSNNGLRPTPEMLQLQLGFVTRTADAADVPVQVIQGGTEATLHMKLN